jgi:hypothetical protein
VAACSRTGGSTSPEAGAPRDATGDVLADGAGDGAPADTAAPADVRAGDASVDAPFDGTQQDSGPPPDSSALIETGVADGASADADGGAMPTTCADGSPVTYARTMCAPAGLSAPAALVTAVGGATRGDVVSLGGLSEPAAPCAPVLVCTPVSAPTMLFSDDPESPSTDGVLYADVIGPGAYRAYVYHTNAGTGLRKFPVVLLNQGATDVNVVLGPKGVAGPGTDYVAVGKAAIVAWLGATTTQTLVVPAGQRVLLDADLDAVHAANGELAHGILDFTLDGPVKLSVVSVAAAEDAATVTAGLSLLPDDQLHQRGTFPGATRLLQGTTALDGTGVRHLTLGDGVADVDLAGHDAVDGTSVSLGGNYGLVYQIALTAGVHTGFVVAPQGGAWGGGAGVPLGEDGPAGVVALPGASSSLGSQSEAIAVGRFVAQSSVTLTLISAGGSNLPVDLASVPLP